MLIKEFKEGVCTILVATDVASRGLGKLIYLELCLFINHPIKWYRRERYQVCYQL